MSTDSPSPDSLPASEEAEGGLFTFAGWGTATKLTDLSVRSGTGAHSHKTLGTWASTAICGNDITSSCLYVSALAAAQAGALAPVALGLVAVVLYLFRSVYAEVGSALPLNGGTYTVLLNTSNKKFAAGAAVLTLLSYVATAVISAGEASHYAFNLYDGLNIMWGTVGLLGFFAFLNVVGISESAVVAIAIFAFHMLTLVVLSVVCGAALASDPSIFIENWSTVGDVTLGGFVRALFFGFAAAMLGISGFESSANFIEEQKEGVFPKTLRNMWAAVSIFNPLISLLSLAMLPLFVIQHGGEEGNPPADLLARMGNEGLSVLGLATGDGGTWLGTMVSVDAVLVLSGAVLTSYVGVTGLVRRMTLDRCLPQFLLARNRFRGTDHWIILGFFFVCCSILVSTGGDVGVLAGVYTISFLSVMSLFAVGNMMLKVKRRRLPRATRASWPAVSIALTAVLAGLLGNVIMKPEGVKVFGFYFLIFGTTVAIMFLRLQLMRLVLFITRAIVDRVKSANDLVVRKVNEAIQDINSREIIYFTRGDDAAMLNRAALYVMENEQTAHMRVIHVYQDEEQVPEGLAETLSEIDHLYPELRIDFTLVKGCFGPELIEALSERLEVAKNYMFIGTPGDKFPHRIEALGGVRLIL